MLRVAHLLRAQPVRWISKNPRVLESQVMRKIKKKIDRLPSQGKDPASAFKHGWRYASATMLERYPVVIPECHPFEEEYLKGRFLADQRRSKPIPPELFLSERDIIEGKTEPTFEDPLADQYIPAPRVTEADRTNDTKSLERALPERLYFLIKSERATHYRFPQTIADDDEVRLWTFAERAFKTVTHAASRQSVHYIAPRPCCHLEHVYPVNYQTKYNVYGIKIFFYRAVLLFDQKISVKNNTDYVWARACELEQFVGTEYYNGIKPALYGVGPSNNYDV